MELSKKDYYSNLFDFYKNLLSEKQKLYFERHIFDDYSLGEIAEELSITRNAVHSQIKIVIEKLDYYEENLHLFYKSKEIIKIVEKIKETNDDSYLNELLTIDERCKNGI